jgi:hypothetical protein
LTETNGKGAVACDIHDYTDVAPPPTACGSGDWFLGDDFKLDQGNPPYLVCHTGGVINPPPKPTLEYGQTRSLDTITCDSEPSHMTCTDSSTGHFLRVSRDSYELG